jgi:hypothetical protein
MNEKQERMVKRQSENEEKEIILSGKDWQSGILRHNTDRRENGAS